MRYRTLEIRWHDSKPISTCDFQPVPYKKARPTQDAGYATQSWRLATGGEDNHVRIWMVQPNILPTSIVEGASASGQDVPAPRPPRIEYHATLSRHSASVNVVRFSPNGELIASAGDDGMIIIWAASASSHTSYGSDLSPEDLQYEKEHWKPRMTVKCTSMQVYDLAWSPTGEYIIAGSTDNVARVYAAVDGRCVCEIAEHNHYVQGVAWDPMNEYIATQSSDRSMHIYKISTKNGNFEAHAVGKNTKMPHRHTRTPSQSQNLSRPRMSRRESTTSDAESIVTSASEQPQSAGRDSGRESHVREESVFHSSASVGPGQTPLTPATSVGSTPAMFPPPPMEKTTSSRRSSFSGSNAGASPYTHARFMPARSPSPMPALPAIRSPAPSMWQNVKLYGDESFSNFFRRLNFSPDGGLLLTPAGQFEDPSVLPSSFKRSDDDQPTRGRKNSRLTVNTLADSTSNSSSSVYIYSRANFARPPIAQLPGHKKASIAVRFSPVLYELRKGLVGAEEVRMGVVEKGVEGKVALDLVDPTGPLPTPSDDGTSSTSHLFATPSKTGIIAPAPVLPGASIPPSPSTTALSPLDHLRPPTPAASKPSSPAPSTMSVGSSIFALPYRMLFAVETMDTVTIYDTQQSGPVCMLTKLHYDEFTDMAWTPDGQSLILSSRDGYCTLVIFDEILPGHHTQQHTLQLQSIAHMHSIPVSVTPASTSTSLPATYSPRIVPQKRSEPPATPASHDGKSGDLPPLLETPLPTPFESESGKTGESSSTTQEPPKKKRRVALTHVGQID